MPTRVFIRDPSPPPPPSRTRQGVTNNQNIPNRSGSRVRNHQHDRSLRFVSLRSSIVARKTPGVPGSGQNEHISRSDISASPRLVGYLFMVTASIVILVTAVDLYKEGTSNESAESCSPGTLCGQIDDFFVTPTWAVLKWKLYASIGVAAGGTGISFFICLAHIDGIFFPNFWRKLFRDGSKGEMAILIFLLVLWLAGVHVCTSSFSPGEIAANIYFATWLAFASAIMNFSIWLVGADRRSIAEVFHDYPCGTSYNWWMTLIFSLVLSCSVLNGYLERNRLPETYEEFKALWHYFQRDDWINLLAITWSITGTCVLALLLCYFARDSRYLVDMRCCKVRVGWREFELIVLLSLVGLSGYTVFQYTGVDNVLNGITNPYFGSWGTFVFSLLTLGAWLEETKEKKDTFVTIDNKQSENPPTTSEA